MALQGVMVAAPEDIAEASEALQEVLVALQGVMVCPLEDLAADLLVGMEDLPGALVGVEEEEVLSG